jgi:hypothetical protein
MPSSIAVYEDRTPSLLSRSLVLMGALVGASALHVALLSMTAVVLTDRAISGLRSQETQAVETQAHKPLPKKSLVSPKPNG